MKNIFTLTLICALTLLPGCGKYKPATMQKPIGYEKQKENVKVVAKRLSDAECHAYFDSNAIAGDYIPIHVFVKNKSNKTYNFDAGRISLPIEKADVVAQKTYHLNLERFIPEKARRFVKSKEAESDFYCKVMGYDDNALISPHTSINKIIFIPRKNFKPNFNIHLVDTETKNALVFEMWT